MRRKYFTGSNSLEARALCQKEYRRRKAREARALERLASPSTPAIVHQVIRSIPPPCPGSYAVKMAWC